MTKTELDAIREKIAGDPEDSPARMLLAEVDRLKASYEAYARAEVRQRLISENYLTEEEAEKIIALFMRGEMPEMGRARCRACSRTGRSRDSCPKCHGTGTAIQYKIPA